MPTWARTERPGPSDQRVLTALGGVLAVAGQPADQDQQPGDGDDPEQPEADDPDRRACPTGESSGAIRKTVQTTTASTPQTVCTSSSRLPTWNRPAPCPPPHPQAGEHHDHRRQGGEDVDDHGQRHGPRVCLTSTGRRHEPPEPRAARQPRLDLRRRGPQRPPGRPRPAPAAGEPVEQGVDLGHPVAAEGQREADPAHVVGTAADRPRGPARRGGRRTPRTSGRRARRPARPRRP